MFDHLLKGHALLQQLGALVQGQRHIDIAALAQGPRVVAEGHLFVAQQTKVGQHELRPVLVQVAEEHQAQAVAQGLQAQFDDRFGEARQPFLQRPRLQLKRLQLGQQFTLGRPWPLELVGKAAGQLVLAQQLEQLLKAQRAVIDHPALGQQWRQGGRRRADFGVVELAWAKQQALAHHHAHQQGPGGLRLLTEPADEGLLLIVEQVGIAQLDPVEHLLEVVQVIERVVDGMGDHSRLRAEG
ncbi:hypothetical protein D3C85_1140210 [compost metagenome]